MTAFKPLDERHFKHIEKQIENIKESKMYIPSNNLERYTDLLRDALEMYEDAVNIGELSEGEYINYAKQLKEGDKALGKICDIGMRFCKN